MANLQPAQSQVDTRPLATPYADQRITEGDFGAGTAQALGELGAQVERVGVVAARSQMHDKAIGDATQTTSLIGQGNQLINDVVLDPKTGFSAKKGDQALGGHDDAVKALNDGLQKIGAQVQNPDQQKAWALHATQLQKRGLMLINSHTSQQGDVVQTDRFSTATTAITNQLALLDPLDPNTAGARLQGLASLRQLAIARAQTLGIDGNYTAADGSTRSGADDFAAKYLQQGAQTIMDRALATENGAVAKATFQQLQPFLGHLASHYAKPVQEAGDRQIADGLAIRLDRATTSSMGKPDPTAAQGQLDQLFTTGKITPQVYEHAQGRLALRMNERTNAWNKSVDQGFQTAYSTALSKDPQTGLPMVDLNRVPTGSPSQPGTQQWLQAVAPEKYDHLKLMTLRDTRTEDKENAPAARLAHLDALFQLANQPEKFASMTPAAFTSEFGAKLAPKDFDSFGKLWTEHLAQNSKETAHLPPVVIDTALTTGRAAGIFPSSGGPAADGKGGKGWSTDQQDAWDSLTTQLIKEADQYKRTNGVAPKVADLQSMAVNHLVGVKLKGAGLFGSDKTMTALQAEQVNGGVLPGNAEVVSVPGVPAEEVERIKGLLAGAGKVVTGSSILTVYQRQAARKAAGQ